MINYMVDSENVGTKWIPYLTQIKVQLSPVAS